MYSTSLGDHASAFQMTQHNTLLKARMDRLVQELSSGLTSDISKALGGDFARIGDIETSLIRLDAYKSMLSETGAVLTSAQAALGGIQDLSSTLGPDFALAANSNNSTLLLSTSADARQKLDVVIGMLNTQVAGRSLFAGTATDRSALASPEALMAALSAALVGATDASEIISRTTAWFETGGGFETMGYWGSDKVAGLRIAGNGEVANLPNTAIDPAIKEIIKGLMLGSLVSTGLAGSEIDDQVQIVGTASEILLSGETDLSNLRAALGASEAQVDAATARNEAERSALSLARTGILAKDPYEAATELEQLGTQLETLYTVTARLSRLNLADYLR